MDGFQRFGPSDHHGYPHQGRHAMVHGTCVFVFPIACGSRQYVSQKVWSKFFHIYNKKEILFYFN